MRPLAVLLLVLLIVACGPTTVVVNSPTAGASPTAPPTAAPTVQPTQTPSQTGAATPIPLTTPTPSPSSSPTAPPTTLPATGFQVLDGFPTDRAFEVTDVSPTPTGFIAVGFGGLDGDVYFGRHQGVVWTSADGTNWSASIDPSLRNVTPIRVVARGEDLFLVGVLSACPQLPDVNCTDVPEAGNAVWRSSDGAAWERLPQLADMQLGLIDDMFVAGNGIVVYGSGADDNQMTTVWLSPDGASWTSTVDLAGLDPISSMTFGSGGFGAFGTRYVPELGDVLLTAAFSSDGTHFVAATVPQLTGSAIDDVVGGSAGYVGVGYHSTEALDINGIAVRSSDGRTWTEATNSDGTFAGSGLLAVHVLPSGGYVAVGFKPHLDDFTLEDCGAWFSADGQDWRAIAPPSGAFSQLSSSALGTSGLVVFAAEQIDLDEDNVSSIIHAWFAPLAALTV